MDKFKEYNVQFANLKLGEHHFDFKVEQSFFDLFEFDQDFEKPEIDVDLLLIKKTTFMELYFSHQGKLNLICDISNDEYEQSIEGELKVIVKFGHEFDDSDDEVIVIPFGEHSINVAQLVYESILLSIPNKRVKPNLDEEELELLEKFSPSEKDEIDDEKENDPRWDDLKKLLNKK